MTVLPHGLLLVSTNKAAMDEGLSALATYIKHHTVTPLHVVTCACNYESNQQNETR